MNKKCFNKAVTQGMFPWPGIQIHVLDVWQGTTGTSAIVPSVGNREKQRQRLTEQQTNTKVKMKMVTRESKSIRNFLTSGSTDTLKDKKMIQMIHQQ